MHTFKASFSIPPPIILTLYTHNISHLDKLIAKFGIFCNEWKELRAFGSTLFYSTASWHMWYLMCSDNESYTESLYSHIVQSIMRNPRPIRNTRKYMHNHFWTLCSWNIADQRHLILKRCIFICYLLRFLFVCLVFCICCLQEYVTSVEDEIIRNYMPSLFFYFFQHRILICSVYISCCF